MGRAGGVLGVSKGDSRPPGGEDGSREGPPDPSAPKAPGSHRGGNFPRRKPPFLAIDFPPKRLNFPFMAIGEEPRTPLPETPRDAPMAHPCRGGVHAPRFPSRAPGMVGTIKFFGGAPENLGQPRRPRGAQKPQNPKGAPKGRSLPGPAPAQPKIPEEIPARFFARAGLPRPRASSLVPGGNPGTRGGAFFPPPARRSLTKGSRLQVFFLCRFGGHGYPRGVTCLKTPFFLFPSKNLTLMNH